jgi:hypothetical protein
MEVGPGHWAACWFWEEVNKDQDQDAIAAKYGHPLPSQVDIESVAGQPSLLDAIEGEQPRTPEAPELDPNTVV